MAKTRTPPEFILERDDYKCIRCLVCVRVCSYGANFYDEKENRVYTENSKCVGCHFCEAVCPTEAITVKRNKFDIKPSAHWTSEELFDVIKQAETGGILLTSMGNDKPQFNYFDRLVLNASQVTNPSIDPLREPMEIRTYLGKKDAYLEIFEENESQVILKTEVSQQLKLEIPVMFSAMSYGSISLNAIKSLARAAETMGTFFNTGEGGLHKDLKRFGKNMIVQCASGRFGVDIDYLNSGAAVEIKIGQGAKPGIGGHLPGEKVTEAISETRMIPVGTDAISPAPHHDIYSIEDLRQLIFAIKEATRYKKPVGVKIAAVHNVAAIASGIVRAGADFVTIDGIRGGTGATPKITRDHVGIPIEFAIAVVDQRLREEGIRHMASVVVAGGIRKSADVVKAIALGADAVYIGTTALVSLGCHLCQRCYLGKCNWGIATQDPKLVKRLNPEIGARRASNLLKAWTLEIKEILGGMGINAIESLRGNREVLRGVGLNERELQILGIKAAGEAW
ncbi:MAG: hypothetical protein PWQ48_1536 [Thermotogaceae bacterium]|nr:hypothetical protein [Thermotogaceae bacterium]